MKIAIYTEDKYGIKFLKKVINRLISEEYIYEEIEYQKLYEPAHIKKCHNVRKVKAVIREVDRVLIVIDKENSDSYDENREVWRHLSKLSDKD